MGKIKYRINVGHKSEDIGLSLLEFRADSIQIKVDTKQVTVDRKVITS